MYNPVQESKSSHQCFEFPIYSQHLELISRMSCFSALSNTALTTFRTQTSTCLLDNDFLCISQRSPVDSNRFGSSGNVSQASSPYSSDMEDRSESEGSHLKSTSTSRQPSLKAQQSVCEDIKEAESEEKELKPVPEPGVKEDIKQQIVPAKPLEIRDRKPEKQIRYTVSLYVGVALH